MRIMSLIVIIILILVGITFAVLNAQVVEIEYYVGKAEMPLSLLLAVTLLIGALLGIIISFVAYIRLKAENRHLRKRVKVAEKEVENLRAIPLKDSH